MEFPELGQNCSETLCKRLDFLPMKCDACNQIFCKDHIQYNKHTCQNAYWKDVQVPVCPLCNTPVPVKRGEPPDIKVGEHIDRDCQSDPAVAKRKIYTNKCTLKGCKQKELIPVKCDQCLQNFCLKHRHSSDHNCQGFQGSKHPVSQAGAAAITRSQQAKKGTIPKKFHQTSCTNYTQAPVATVVPTPSQNHPASNGSIPSIPVASVQGGLSEDEALALALQQSLQSENIALPSPNSSALKNLQEEEDRMLAQALADSEREATARQQPKDRSRNNCILS